MNLFVILFIIIILIIGMLTEEIILYVQSKKGKNNPGTLIKASKGSINVISKGSGKFTVVFTSSYSVPSPYLDYYTLQNEVSKFTNTAIYERYGYGFSDDIKSAIDLDMFVNDLRFVLKKSGHNPPYIFVAHSMSSLEVLRYAECYPKEIKGIIFEEGLNPKFNNEILLPSIALIRFIQFIKYIGLFRLLLLLPYFKNKYTNSKLSDSLNKMKIRLTIKNIWNENMVNEIKNLKKNCNLILKDGVDLDNIPLRILTAENRSNFSKDLNKLWIKSQKDMKNFSSNSNQLIIEDSDHYIHDDYNDIIICYIKNLLK